MDQAVLGISIVMCAYTERRWDDMIAAIRSVQGQSVTPLEIILVVDHNPALAERARAAFPEITVVENREERGLSGARNTGVAIARGEVVAFIDEDAVADPNWLRYMVPHYSDPNVIGVGGTIEPWWANGRPGWFPEEFDWVVGCTYRGMPTTTAPVRNLIGCNMSLRREIITEVGGFRSGIGRIGTLPVGCEETELCIRAQQRWPERSFLYDPRVRVHHRVTMERATWPYFRSRCYAEGLSKALVARFVGANAGLSSERTYALRVLPSGVLRGIGALITQGDSNGPSRSMMIVTGLAITTFGYIRGNIFQWLRKPATPVVPENG